MPKKWSELGRLQKILIRETFKAECRYKHMKDAAGGEPSNYALGALDALTNLVSEVGLYTEYIEYAKLHINDIPV